MARLRVSISETSYGSVVVDVPDGATEDEIYDAAYNAYCDGKAWFGDTNFGIADYEEE